MLVACLIKPTSAFDSSYGDDEDDDDNDSFLASNVEGIICNESITDLNIGRNKIGSATATALSDMFKQNAVLNTLRMEFCNNLTPKDWKSIFNTIRLYNSSLHQLSLHSNALSVKSCEHLAHIQSSLETRLCQVFLPRCGLQHLHLEALSKYLPTARSMKVLDLSGNDIGNEGAESLRKIIQGSVTMDGALAPPLEYLDLNSCSLTPSSSAIVITAIACRQQPQQHTMNFVDLSYNIIGPKNDLFLDQLANASIVDLRMNYCQLRSSFALSLFQILAHRSPRSYVAHPIPQESESSTSSHLLKALRFLSLAGNEISDSIAPALGGMLANNISLEMLDLGYNSFTNSCATYFAAATQVTSTSSEEMKVYPLHVNLIGNKCDPYLLETPGMARSKLHFLFGTQANREDASSCGYSHIDSRVRGKFIMQKQLDELYRKSFPVQPINHIS
jgi:Ran GTPase-activating protein (RanGAP) involved in mRNA processing and transport